MVAIVHKLAVNKPNGVLTVEEDCNVLGTRSGWVIAKGDQLMQELEFGWLY